MRSMLLDFSNKDLLKKTERIDIKFSVVFLNQEKEVSQARR